MPDAPRSTSDVPLNQRLPSVITKESTNAGSGRNIVFKDGNVGPASLPGPVRLLGKV